MCYTKRITRGISAAFRQPIHFPIAICNFHFQSHHQWKYLEYRSGWKYCTECIGTKGILGISGVVLPNITHQQKWYLLQETNAKGRKYYVSETEKIPLSDCEWNGCIWMYCGYCDPPIFGQLQLSYGRGVWSLGGGEVGNKFTRNFSNCYFEFLTARVNLDKLLSQRKIGEGKKVDDKCWLQTPRSKKWDGKRIQFHC